MLPTLPPAAFLDLCHVEIAARGAAYKDIARGLRADVMFGDYFPGYGSDAVAWFSVIEAGWLRTLVPEPGPEPLPQHGDLRVYFSPCVPSRMFHYRVQTLRQAVQACRLFEHWGRCIAAAMGDETPSMIQGVEILDTAAGGGLEWQEWESADGDDAETVIAEEDRLIGH